MATVLLCFGSARPFREQRNPLPCSSVNPEWDFGSGKHISLLSKATCWKPSEPLLYFSPSSRTPASPNVCVHMSETQPATEEGEFSFHQRLAQRCFRQCVVKMQMAEGTTSGQTGAVSGLSAGATLRASILNTRTTEFSAPSSELIGSNYPDYPLQALDSPSWLPKSSSCRTESRRFRHSLPSQPHLGWTRQPCLHAWLDRLLHTI